MFLCRFDLMMLLSFSSELFFVFFFFINFEFFVSSFIYVVIAVVDLIISFLIRYTCTVEMNIVTGLWFDNLRMVYVNQLFSFDIFSDLVVWCRICIYLPWNCLCCSHVYAFIWMICSCESLFSVNPFLYAILPFMCR